MSAVMEARCLGTQGCEERKDARSGYRGGEVFEGKIAVRARSGGRVLSGGELLGVVKDKGVTREQGGLFCRVQGVNF